VGLAERPELAESGRGECALPLSLDSSPASFLEHALPQEVPGAIERDQRSPAPVQNQERLVAIHRDIEPAA